MKIGIVTTWFERGASYVSKQFLDVLSGEHEVFIYARGGEEYAKGDHNWDGEYVTWGEQPNSWAPTAIHPEDFQHWLLSNQLDIVIFNEQKVWAPILACRELGVITAAYIDYYTEKTVPCYGVHDFLICNTRRHESVFINHPQCLYIPWGTDTNLYQLTNEQLVSDDTVTFFHSSGMSPHRKGTDLLLKSFQPLKDKAKLVIHSQVDVGEAFPALKNLISELTEEGSLEIIQETVTAPGLYHLGDVYVYPSRLDGIGLTILEAAATGMPIIVPDNGPMNEFVAKDNCNGRVVPIEKLWSRWDGYYWPQCEVNVNGLTESLNHYIIHSDNLPQIKKAARTFAQDNFDWAKNAHQLSFKIKTVRRLSDIEVKEAISYAKKIDIEQYSRFEFGGKEIISKKIKNSSLYRILTHYIDIIRK